VRGVQVRTGWTGHGLVQGEQIAEDGDLENRKYKNEGLIHHGICCEMGFLVEVAIFS